MKKILLIIIIALFFSVYWGNPSSYKADALVQVVTGIDHKKCTDPDVVSRQGLPNQGQCHYNIFSGRKTGGKKCDTTLIILDPLKVCPLTLGMVLACVPGASSRLPIENCHTVNGRVGAKRCLRMCFSGGAGVMARDSSAGGGGIDGGCSTFEPVIADGLATGEICNGTIIDVVTEVTAVDIAGVPVPYKGKRLADGTCDTNYFDPPEAQSDYCVDNSGNGGRLDGLSNPKAHQKKKKTRPRQYKAVRKAFQKTKYCRYEKWTKDDATKYCPDEASASCIPYCIPEFSLDGLTPNFDNNQLTNPGFSPLDPCPGACREPSDVSDKGCTFVESEKCLRLHNIEPDTPIPDYTTIGDAKLAGDWKGDVISDDPGDITRRGEGWFPPPDSDHLYFSRTGMYSPEERFIHLRSGTFMGGGNSGKPRRFTPRDDILTANPICLDKDRPITAHDRLMRKDKYSDPTIHTIQCWGNDVLDDIDNFCGTFIDKDEGIHYQTNKWFWLEDPANPGNNCWVKKKSADLYKVLPTDHWMPLALSAQLPDPTTAGDFVNMPVESNPYSNRYGFLGEYGYRNSRIVRMDYPWDRNNIYNYNPQNDPSGPETFVAGVEKGGAGDPTSTLPAEMILHINNMGAKRKKKECLKVFIEEWAHRGDCGEIVIAGAMPNIDVGHCQWVAMVDNSGTDGLLKGATNALVVAAGAAVGYEDIEESVVKKRGLRSEYFDYENFNKYGFIPTMPIDPSKQGANTDICLLDIKPGNGDKFWQNDGLDFSKRGCPTVSGPDLWYNKLDMGSCKSSRGGKVFKKDLLLRDFWLTADIHKKVPAGLGTWSLLWFMETGSMVGIPVVAMALTPDVIDSFGNVQGKMKISGKIDDWIDHSWVAATCTHIVNSGGDNDNHNETPDLYAVGSSSDNPNTTELPDGTIEDPFAQEQTRINNVQAALNFNNAISDVDRAIAQGKIDYSQELLNGAIKADLGPINTVLSAVDNPGTPPAPGDQGINIGDDDYNASLDGFIIEGSKRIYGWKFNVSQMAGPAMWCDFEIPYTPYVEGNLNRKGFMANFLALNYPPEDSTKLMMRTLMRNPLTNAAPGVPLGGKDLRLGFKQVERIRDGCGAFSQRGTWQLDNHTQLASWLINKPHGRCQDWRGLYRRKYDNIRIVSWRLPRFTYEFMKAFIECTGPIKPTHKVCGKTNWWIVAYNCIPKTYGGCGCCWKLDNKTAPRIFDERNKRPGFWCRCKGDNYVTSVCNETMCTCDQYRYSTPHLTTVLPFCFSYGPFKRWLECYYQARAKSCPILTREISSDIISSTLMQTDPEEKGKTKGYYDFTTGTTANTGLDLTAVDGITNNEEVDNANAASGAQQVDTTGTVSTDSATNKANAIASGQQAIDKAKNILLTAATREEKVLIDKIQDLQDQKASLVTEKTTLQGQIDDIVRPITGDNAKLQLFINETNRYNAEVAAVAAAIPPAVAPVPVPVDAVLVADVNVILGSPIGGPTAAAAADKINANTTTLTNSPGVGLVGTLVLGTSYDKQIGVLTTQIAGIEGQITALEIQMIPYTTLKNDIANVVTTIPAGADPVTAGQDIFNNLNALAERAANLPSVKTPGATATVDAAGYAAGELIGVITVAESDDLINLSIQLEQAGETLANIQAGGTGAVGSNPDAVYQPVDLFDANSGVAP